MAQRGSLSPERIVDAAIVMLDEEGEKGFSMRRLAARLDVDPMALYHHIPNRMALMRAVLDAWLRGCAFPPVEGDWKTRVRSLCHALRDLAHRHPGCFAVYVSFEDWVPSEHHVYEAFYAALADGGFSPRANAELELHEAFHQTLRDAGFDDTRTVYGARRLLSFVEGFAWDELNGWIGQFNRDEQHDLHAALEQGAYPVTRSLIPVMAEPDPDREFELGLETQIMGLEAQRKSLARAAR